MEVNKVLDTFPFDKSRWLYHPAFHTPSIRLPPEWFPLTFPFDTTKSLFSLC